MCRKSFLFIYMSVFFGLQLVSIQAQTVNDMNDYEFRRQQLSRLNEGYKRQPKRLVAPMPRNTALSKEQLEKIKTTLALDPADVVTYKEFLRQPKTGFFRLMPNLGCNEKYVVNVARECENMPPIGDYYSFRNKAYVNGSFFDITFKDDSLHSKSFLSQTILVKLGDVALKDVSLATAGVKFLADFVPQAEDQAVKAQTAEITKGVNEGGYKYSNVEKAFLNKTYVLRVIAYRFDEATKSRFKKTGQTYEQMTLAVKDTDSRDDLIVAFRIIRQDTDGSLSILWKELGRKPSPTITFQEDER